MHSTVGVQFLPGYKNEFTSSVIPVQTVLKTNQDNASENGLYVKLNLEDSPKEEFPKTDLLHSHLLTLGRIENVAKYLARAELAEFKIKDLSVRMERMNEIKDAYYKMIALLQGRVAATNEQRNEAIEGVTKLFDQWRTADGQSGTGLEGKPTT